MNNESTDPITKPAGTAKTRAPGAPTGTYCQLVEEARKVIPDDLPDNPAELLFAFDIDGTILQADGTISSRMKHTVEALIAVGAHIVLASGRGPNAITGVIRQLGLTEGFAVCANGAVTVGLDMESPTLVKILHEKKFVPREALLALRKAMPEGLLGVEIAGKGFRLTEPFPKGELVGEQEIVELEELLDEPVVRVVARQPQMNVDEFEKVVKSAGLHSVEYAIGWTSWLDIAPQGITKASALEVLREELGVSEKGTFAFGDGWNDVQMLQWAYRGIAMGDSPLGVVEVADLRAATVTEDGVPAYAHAILERYGKTLENL
ncbi:Cof-type HAD-IIB family hydrolase [Actinomycetaceae bacterium TAE3-ERU4]|nr:Cof-type HAD-IIB family hydrolase [Actinomycetaceae bacterium TAE3-ERU4]